MARPYKFGFSEFTTWPWPFRQDLEEYKKAGADYIEICEFKLSHENYADELALVGKHGLTPSSIQAKVHSIYPDTMATEPKDPADRVTAIKKAIEMSAPHLPKGTPFIVITGVAPNANVREAIDRTAGALSELGDFAAKHGMKIAFEPLNPVTLHTDTALWGLDRGIELVERVNHPSVGICIDTWNIWETPHLGEIIERCGRRILVVQISDWRMPRSTADRYTLGTGTLMLDRMMRAIRRTGFDGPWVVEILSALHLDGSLWKSDMRELLRKNAGAFDRLWKESEP